MTSERLCGTALPTMQEPQPNSISSIKGLTVAITGKCWTTRFELSRLIKLAGGRVASGRVTRSTDVLVRGESDFWKFGKYGKKEAAAARLLRRRKQVFVIDDYEFQKLIERRLPARLSTVIAGQPIE